jgi:hypothetical protein
MADPRLVWKGRIECDGLIPEQYSYLYEMRAFSSCHFPETVIFERGWPKVWYAWEPSEAGGSAVVLRRHLGKDINEDTLIQRFTLDANGEPPDSHQVIAEYAHYDGENGFSLEYLDCAGLTKFICGRSAGRTGVLQRFVVAKAANNTVIQAVWSPTMTFLTTRQSQATFGSMAASLSERCCTFDGPPQLSMPGITSEFLRQRVDRLLSEFAALILSTENARLKGIVAYFKLARNGRLILLRCTSLRTRPDPSLAGILRKPVNILATMRSPPVETDDNSSTVKLRRMGALTDIATVDAAVYGADGHFRRVLREATYIGCGKSDALRLLEMRLARSGEWVRVKDEVDVLLPPGEDSPVFLGRARTQWRRVDGTNAPSSRSPSKDRTPGAMSDLDMRKLLEVDASIAEDVLLLRHFPPPPAPDDDTERRRFSARTVSPTTVDPRTAVPSDPHTNYRSVLFETLLDASYHATAFRADSYPGNPSHGVVGLATAVVPEVPFSEEPRYKFMLPRSLWQPMNPPRMNVLKRLCGLYAEHAFDEVSGRRVDVLCFTAPRYYTQREVMDVVLQVFPSLLLQSSANHLLHLNLAQLHDSPSSATLLARSNSLVSFVVDALHGSQHAVRRRKDGASDAEESLTASQGGSPASPSSRRGSGSSKSNTATAMQPTPSAVFDAEGDVDNEAALLSAGLSNTQRSQRRLQPGGWRRAFGLLAASEAGPQSPSGSFVRHGSATHRRHIADAKQRSAKSSSKAPSESPPRSDVSKTDLDNVAFDTSSSESGDDGADGFMKTRFGNTSHSASGSPRAVESTCKMPHVPATGTPKHSAPRSGSSKPAALDVSALVIGDSHDQQPSVALHPGTLTTTNQSTPGTARSPRKPEEVDWRLSSTFPAPKPPSEASHRLTARTTRACLDRRLQRSADTIANVTIASRARNLNRSVPMFVERRADRNDDSTSARGVVVPPVGSGACKSSDPAKASKDQSYAAHMALWTSH